MPSTLTLGRGERYGRLTHAWARRRLDSFKPQLWLPGIPGQIHGGAHRWPRDLKCDGLIGEECARRAR